MEAICVETANSDTIIQIVCHKISNKLDLNALASYFDVPYSEKSPKYIRLNDKALSSIIKVRSSSKFLFMYEYGCIVFVGFSSDEIYFALGYLETITGTVDYKLISQFNENLILSLNNRILTGINDFPCELEFNEDILNLACGLISKSIALYSAEEEVASVLDNVEDIVNYLQKAKLRINTKNFVSKISHMARFQYSIIKAMAPSDRTFTSKKNANSKHFYNILYLYYEIDDRTKILESKIDEVNRLISRYTTLSYNIGEMRLLIFECVLLFMFLLPHIINFKALFK